MNSTNKSPTLNPMARQEIYISPKLYPLNKAYAIDSSDDSSDTNSTPLFSSNDSLSSFEDYKIQAELEKKEEKKVEQSTCNRGFISSVCCSFFKRD